MKLKKAIQCLIHSVYTYQKYKDNRVVLFSKKTLFPRIIKITHSDYFSTNFALKWNM